MRSFSLASKSVAAILAVEGGFVNVQKFAVVVQFYREASQTRDYRVAKNAPQRAARPDRVASLSKNEHLVSSGAGTRGICTATFFWLK
jgi:hypothetical protein